MEHTKEKTKLAIIGLGYVGLPLCVEFARKYPTVGFDISARRVDELSRGHDRTLEVDEADLSNVCATTGLKFSTVLSDIADCNIYIVTVPTPVDKYNRPDMRPLLGASDTVGKV